MILITALNFKLILHCTAKNEAVVDTAQHYVKQSIKKVK